MNEDETTQALSDKVLDRSCVMRFGRPKQLSEQDDSPRTIPNKNGLTFDQWKSFEILMFRMTCQVLPILNF